MYRKKSILCMLLIILLTITTSTILKTTSAEIISTAVYVDPPEILDLPLSTTFDVNIKIRNVTNFYGLDVRFQWDPTILDYVGHTTKIPVETYPDGVLYEPTLKVRDEADAVAGTVVLVYSSMLPAPSFNGTGTIVTITLHVIDVGRCSLDIYLSDISDIDGMPIPHIVEDGVFDNRPAPTPAKLSVYPEKIINATLIPCENFTIDTNIENVVDLSSFEFWLGYNTTVLDVSNVTVNPIFPPPIEIDIIEPEGEIRVAASISPPVSGNLTLASVTFHVTATGESILDLHNVTLIDVWGEPIPYEEPTDGFFSNILKARLYVDPPSIIDPKYVPSTIFTIDIKVENAIDLYGYEFNLTYDRSVLICLGAVIIPPNNDTNFDPTIHIDNDVGYIWVNVVYYPPAEPITILAPQTLVTITFEVRTFGATVLGLQDTNLVDNLGNPIYHEVNDGFFCGLMRDVAIVSVEASPKTVYSGRIVTITVVAENKGNLTESFNVTCYHKDEVTGIEDPIGTKEVVDLAPNENYTLTYNWDTTGLEPCHNHTIRAEASLLPYELDEENNIYTDGQVKIKMWADVNGDGIIDIYDVVLVASIYELTEADPDWNPDADLAPPWGRIDIYDVVTVASRYGQSC